MFAPTAAEQQPPERGRPKGPLFTQLEISAAGSRQRYSALYKLPAPCQLWNWPALHIEGRDVVQPPDATPDAAAGSGGETRQTHSKTEIREYRIISPAHRGQ